MVMVCVSPRVDSGCVCAGRRRFIIVAIVARFVLRARRGPSEVMIPQQSLEQRAQPPESDRRARLEAEE
jgi:hypothetical protein